MTAVQDTRKSELIDQVGTRIAERLEPGRVEGADRFARSFYAGVPPDDFADETADNLYGSALAIWGFAQRRKPDEPKVRVYTPRLDEHGWRSTHTIVEIVNDDMPFLVSSVTQALNELRAEVQLVIHPVMEVERDAKGVITTLSESTNGREGLLRESFMQVHVSAQPAEKQALIRTRLEEVFADVRLAVEDWEAMLTQSRELINDLEYDPPALPIEEVREAMELLLWLQDDHFTYLGYREVSFEGEGDGAIGIIDAERGLGVLRDPETALFSGLRNLGTLPKDVRDFINRPELVQIIKTNRRSRVHRAVLMDAIVVKRIGPEGTVTGLQIFAGLFSSIAYSRSPRGIPTLRRKVETVFARSGFERGSYDGRALMHILDTYPRDELFQISESQLYATAMGILHLQERQRIAVFPRTDPFERFVTCLVYCPRDGYDTELRLKFQYILEFAFDGKVSEFYTRITDAPLARLLFFIETTPGAIPVVDVREVESQMADAARAWDDRLHTALIEDRGEEPGIRAFDRFAKGFPAAYRDRFNEFAAVMDTQRMEHAIETGEPALNLYRPIEARAHQAHFKIYAPGEPLPLSDVLPMIENMGLKVLGEVPYRIRPSDRDVPVWIRDFEMVTRDGRDIDLGAVRTTFHEAFARVWAGELEDDGFNQLVIAAGLTYREVTVLRAYCKFLRQARTAFSERYMQQTLASNPRIARLLVDLFLARFDPDRERAPADEKRIVREIRRLLDDVTNLDQDRIIRRFLNLVLCTLRTNFFQKGEDGRAKEYLSFKLDSRHIVRLPLPRPYREIFVHSPRVQGVHLRGGKVARGGLRWSDRREDFRTEVLGLMKAQMTKNSVIVPVGSKGGFVVKRPPTEGGREALQAEGIECYKTFLRGLLDLTDSLDGDDIVPPPRVVRRDGDDPYLVVAADKGTATFSDTANGVARDYGFWLDDAFASGGSAGYDHKVMGITAKGAWESVKRHFRELGKDIQTEDFTTVGCGDMSGDVFGNGMLLSRHTKLLAAFNHMHVFVDPDPDPETSFVERQRLFDLPRSTWEDYDAALISEGGAVFERSAKSITVSSQVRELLGLESVTMTPNDLIRAILKADVELLWLGGIGTYVKARAESDADVGDRANDPLRIDGTELRARVVGEGANLGMTQLGRIEYAQAGGHLNVDAIDNSAGVDCSDHEVNIKILLGQVERAGDMTRKQRNQLLVRMTDEVGELVLRDNYLQAQAISVTHNLGAHLLDRLARVMRELEKSGHLNRAIEFLPDDETLAERFKKREGFARPELAVLLSYAKIVLYDELLRSDLPDDPYMERGLREYFPVPLQEDFADAISRHRLRREIIATVVTNEIVNRVGISFIHEVKEKTGMPAADIARAYVVGRTILGVDALWAELEADPTLDGRLQTSLLAECGRAIERCTVWFLREIGQPLDPTALIEEFGEGMSAVADAIEELVSADDRADIFARVAEFIEDGASEDLAHRIARLPWLPTACDIVRIASASEIDVDRAARVYFTVGERFGFNWLRRSAHRLPSDTSWEKRAVSAVMDDLFGHQFELTRHVFTCEQGEESPTELIDCWSKGRTPLVARTDQLLAELRSVVAPDLAMLAVASRQLKSMSVSG